jgi:hypothetical protein
MLFDMLEKRTYGAFLSPNRRFEFFIELDETIPLTIMEGIEHGSGQIRKSVKCELYFMLKVCIFRAFVRHTYLDEELTMPSQAVLLATLRLRVLNHRIDSTIAVAPD